MKYTHFQVNDFVTDTFFQQWVRAPDEYTNTFWQQWIENHPEQRETIRQAMILVKSLEIQEIEYHEDDFQGVKQNIKAQIFGDEQHKKNERKLTPQKNKSQWPMLAAMVSGLVFLSGFLLYNWLLCEETFSTGNGEQLEVKLPDGSLAMLNANTSLRVSADWEDEREIWLEGEAFFEVKKIKEKDIEGKKGDEFRKFTVHATEIDVEVLGTSFNVLDRREVTMVVLEEGIVELKKMQANDACVRMHPGELVSYSNQDKSFKRQKANTRTSLGWKNGKHVFEATPLMVIGKVLEDNYGLKVVIDSEALGKRRFSANVPYGALDLLLSLIQESMHVDIKRMDGAIIIREKP